MILAAIDIGTNSTRLLVAERVGSALRVVRHELASTRLGQGIGRGNVLLREAQERTALAVREFLATARELGATWVRLFATSAVRDAANREEFLERMEEVTGLRPEVLSGETEARLSYLGATRVLGVSGLTLVIDVGGGSTELIWGEGPTVHFVRSLNIGAVRLTEAYLKEDPPGPEEWAALKQAVAAALGPVALPWRGKTAQTVAVGGTATTLAALAQGLTEYQTERIQGYFLSATRLKEMEERLALLSSEERKRLPGVPAARADIIAAGTVILAVAVQELELSGVTVSDADLLLGSLYGALEGRERPA